jgi:hypothetical protein
MNKALETLKYLDNMDIFGIDTAEAKTAGLYSVSGETTELVAEHGDVYDLLDNPMSSMVAQLSDSVIVRTCGWAAPIARGDDDEVAPSQHPERRRVRLLVCANATDTASVIRFSDDWDNPVYDEGQATGALADAVRSLFV